MKNSNVTLDQLVNEITSSIDTSLDKVNQVRTLYVDLLKYIVNNMDIIINVLYKLNKYDNFDSNEWSLALKKIYEVILNKCLIKLDINDKALVDTSFDYLVSEFNNKYKNGGYVNEKYIASKFEVLFNKTFNCNNGDTKFNKMNYRNQLLFINSFINFIFKDIKDKECYSNVIFDDIEGINNIIKIHSIRMVYDGSYELLFKIFNGDEPIYYSFNLTSNIFKSIDYDRYISLINSNIKAMSEKELKKRLD